MKPSFARVGVSVLALCGLAACSGSTPPPETPAFESQVPPAPIPPAPTETMGSPKTEAPVQPPPQETVTDEQIAAILAAANTGEVDQATLAKTHAKDAKVKKYAAMMLTHHGEALKKDEKLVTKLGLSPSDSPVSQKMKKDSDELVAKLKTMKGDAFDREYIDAQVTQHQQVLDLMDKKLIPQAKNDELKQAVVGFRPKVESHLKEAQAIQAALPPKQ